MTNVQASDAGNYWVVVSNAFGNVTSSVAVVYVNLAVLESGFNAAVNPYGSIWSIAVQLNGDIVVAGPFSELHGQTRLGFGRLHADGTLDAGFDARIRVDGHTLALRTDGKILVDSQYHGSKLYRMNINGSVDGGFDISDIDHLTAPVRALVPQPDGKVLVGGSFTSVGGQTHKGVARLNANETIDNGFIPEVDGDVYSLAVQADGKVLVGGAFGALNGEARSRLGRLHGDGTLDADFNPGVGVAAVIVYSVAEQPDGKILVGGTFAKVGGQPRARFARLHADGTLDSAFDPMMENPGGNVWTIALQADSKILVGGAFWLKGDSTRSYLARLNPDGSVDRTFAPGLSAYVHAVTLQADGKVLVGGVFTAVGEVPRYALARLVATGPATQSLAFTDSTITWLRGGTSPELVFTSFEQSTDGVTWSRIGAGDRIPGGWQRSGVVLESNAVLRARGWITTPGGGTAAWFVESVFATFPQTPLNILTRDGSFGFHEDRFGFNVGGASGQIVVMERTVDFHQWIAVSTNVINNGSVYFDDLGAAQAPWHFYRVRLWP